MVAEKERRLREILAEMGDVAVGFSGGVDSALLAHAAHAVLGERAVAMTARSASLPARELREARAVAEQIGIRHVIIDTGEVADPRYAANPSNRCYYCKTELFTAMSRLAADLGLHWLAYGENLDDQGDHRPGAKAAGEWQVRAPLKEAGLTKEDIRELARQAGLPVWDKPAFACLSSRFPYGTAISPEKLAQVEAAEDLLWELGFRQFRVRHHGDLARIEVEPAALAQAVAHAGRISEALQALGFAHVTLDLQGYRRGGFNAALPDELPVLE